MGFGLDECSVNKQKMEKSEDASAQKTISLTLSLSHLIGILFSLPFTDVFELSTSVQSFNHRHPKEINLSLAVVGRLAAA